VGSGLRLTQQLVSAHAGAGAGTTGDSGRSGRSIVNVDKYLHLSEAFPESCRVLVLGVDIERDADDKVGGRIVDAREL